MGAAFIVSRLSCRNRDSRRVRNLTWVCSCLALDLQMSLFLRHYSLVRNYKTTPTEASGEEGVTEELDVKEKVELDGEKDVTTPTVSKI